VRLSHNLRQHSHRLTAGRSCQPDEVRLKIGFCGICGSDIHEYLGAPIFSPAPGTKNEHTGISLPVTMGHEMSGTVIEVGTKVKGLTPGQMVCVNPSLDDRHYGEKPCSNCETGKTNLCTRWATYGLNASGGGFSDEIVVKDINCLPLPPGVSLKVGALAEPLAVAWHSIRTSQFKAAQTVLILGAGPIGLAILLLLRSWEAGKTFVTEVAEQRIEQARKFGADVVVNPIAPMSNGPANGTAKNPVLEAIHESHPTGVDMVFDCTGLQSTLDTGIAALKPGGTFFNVAIHEKPLQLNLNLIACQEKKLLGGICYTREDFERVIDALADGKIPFEEMITSVVPLNDVFEGGFKELINNRSQHIKILVQP
jgi:(R,R)-butanediol dehydrogenase / meso-butanediol dehydrogenase / diacetyl reductase